MQLYLQNKSFSAPTFGSPIASRAFACGEYRFGFNGFEKDDEVKGISHHISYGDYGYDSRIGRRLNIDPFIFNYSYLSSYVHANNSPIIYIDKDGNYFFLVTGAVGLIANVVIGVSKGERTLKELGKRAVVGAIAGAGASVLTIGAAAVATNTTFAVAATYSTAQTISVLGGFGTTYLTMLGTAMSSLAANIVGQGMEILSGKRNSIDGDDAALSFVIGFGTGSLSTPFSGMKDLITKEFKRRLLDNGSKAILKKKALNATVNKTLELISNSNENVGITYKVVNGVIEIVGAVSAGAAEAAVKDKLTKSDAEGKIDNQSESDTAISDIDYEINDDIKNE